MGIAKIELLETSFSPRKLRFVVEVIPADGETFHVPLEDAGKKLNAVANYARMTFAITSDADGTPPSATTGRPGTQLPALSPRPASGPSAGNDLSAMKARAVAKELAAGPDRALQALEKGVMLARQSGTPQEVARATECLARARAYREKLK